MIYFVCPSPPPQLRAAHISHVENISVGAVRAREFEELMAEPRQLTTELVNAIKLEETALTRVTCNAELLAEVDVIARVLQKFRSARKVESPKLVDHCRSIFDFKGSAVNAVGTPGNEVCTVTPVELRQEVEKLRRVLKEVRLWCMKVSKYILPA